MRNEDHGRRAGAHRSRRLIHSGRTMKRMLLAAAAATLALVCGCAGAASSGTAELSNFGIQLTSTDGSATPVLTEVAPGGQTTATETGISTRPLNVYDNQFSITPFGALIATSTLDDMSAISTSGGDLNVGTGDLFSQARRNDSDDYNTSDAGTGVGLYFSLAPGTKMIISGDLFATAASDSAPELGNASASAYLYVIEQGGYSAVLNNHAAATVTMAGTSVGSSSDSASFSFEYDELLGGDRFELVLNTAADTGPTSPVPEPSVALLLLTGFSACAGTRWRRSRSR